MSVACNVYVETLLTFRILEIIVKILRNSSLTLDLCKQIFTDIPYGVFEHYNNECDTVRSRHSAKLE